jgi:hypothetical protein
MVGVRGWCLGRWRRARGAVQSLGNQAEDVGAAARHYAWAPWRAAKEWARSNPPSVIALAITLLAIAVLVVEWWLIGGKTILALDAFDLIGEPEKKVEAYGKLLPAMGLLAATPVGVAGVALAFWRSWNQHRDGLTAIRKLDAEAFAKAVEQLGHDKSSIRMGAVLALEALGKSTPRLLSQAIEILCFYVRETQPASAIRPITQTSDSSRFPPFPTDMQLILDIVARLKREDQESRIRIDLSHTDLRNANLSGANLSRAGLWGANLSTANLADANLRKASLGGANLSYADLNGASLKNAYLNWVNLRGAEIAGTDLTDTIFENTTLPDGRVWTGQGPPPAPVTNA